MSNYFDTVVLLYIVHVVLVKLKCERRMCACFLLYYMENNDLPVCINYV